MNLSVVSKNYLAAVLLFAVAVMIGGYALLNQTVQAQGDTPITIGDGSLIIQSDTPWAERGNELEHSAPLRTISWVRITENGAPIASDFDCRTQTCAVTVTAFPSAGSPITLMARTVKQDRLLSIRVAPDPFSAGWRRLDGGRRYVRDGFKVREVSVQRGPGQPARFRNLSGTVLVSICYGSC